MLFKNSVRTSKRTPHFTITKINWLTLFKFKETVTVCTADEQFVVMMAVKTSKPWRGSVTGD
jgi:hypothetical protein